MGYKKFETKLIILLFLLMVVGDSLLTWASLSIGGFELNPFMQPIVKDKLFHIGLKIVAFLAVLFLVNRLEDMLYRISILSFAVGMYFSVCINNLFTIITLLGLGGVFWI